MVLQTIDGVSWNRAPVAVKRQDPWRLNPRLPWRLRSSPGSRNCLPFRPPPRARWPVPMAPGLHPPPFSDSGERTLVASDEVLLVVTKERSYTEYFGIPRLDLAVFVATTSGSAMELLFERRPDVLLLDLEGGEIPGLLILQAAKRLRRAIVAVVLSPDPSEADASILQDGVFYYCSRPPDPAALEVVIAAARATACIRANRDRTGRGYGTGRHGMPGRPSLDARGQEGRRTSSR